MSNTRTEGYTSDVAYTYGYYREQEPEFINYSAVMHGVAPIALEDGFTYCELGCGHGLTCLIMAANYPQGEFWAMDYNADYIAQAQKMAEQAGLTNVHFLRLSFQELVDAHSLIPPSDFITLHGIYTWVNDNNREHIKHILKRNLKPGGFVYNSYNAMPGWSAIMPLQTALNELSHTMSGSSIERFNASRDFIRRFRTLNPRYFEFNQQTLTGRLDIIEENADINYLIHEYLHDGWKPFHFHEVARQMAAAELDYIGQGSPAESYAGAFMPEELTQALSSLGSIELQQMFKDIAYNTSFRTDLYAKGAQPIGSQQQLAWLQQKQWRLVPAKTDGFDFNCKLSVGLIEGSAETYMTVVDALKQTPAAFDALRQTTQLNPAALAQMLTFLFHINIVAIGGEQSSQGEKLNRKLALYPQSDKHHFISAPGIQTGILLNDVDFKILQYYFDSPNEAQIPESLAQTLHTQLDVLRPYLHSIDEASTDEMVSAKLLGLAKAWQADTMPMWKELGII